MVRRRRGGAGTYHLKDRKFTAFELLAVGDRWGGTGCNHRHNDPDPLGIALTLARDTPGERLPPGFLGRYGWEPPKRD